MDTFSVLEILPVLSFPPASLAVAVVLALVLALFGWRRAAQAVVALGIAHPLILSFQPVGDALMPTLEDQAREAARQAPACCHVAIVVLGGGISPAHPPEPPPTTGAEAMRVFLLDLGVPTETIRDEPEALNTVENIGNVHAMLGDGRVARVTSAYHRPRALQIAAQAKLNVGACPTDYQATPSVRLPWDSWMPSIDRLGSSIMAIKELIALNLDFRRSSPIP
jgi:uncharacterized SAM-binding protein YcdF (DUF218 family)